MAGLVSVFALYASGSRSAWIGLALCLAVIGWLLIRTRRGRLLFGAVAAAVVIVAAGSFWVLKHNVALQNAVLHTQDNSAVTTSSNEAHVSAVKTGLTDVAHQPLGDGPGTAGPASAYNAPHPVRIAEDYYVQVVQETGWLGLALFLSILALVATELYQRASGSPLALAVFVALIGVMFINLLSHAWTDDTLAFLWWGLAAVALGTRRKKTASHHV
jgi:O-antigen ligase